MSLQVNDSSRRGRSRSPGRRERDRSRGRSPAPEVVQPIRMPSPPSGYNYDDPKPSSSRPTYGYDDRRTSYRREEEDDRYYRSSRRDDDDDDDDDDEYSKYSRKDRDDRRHKDDRKERSTADALLEKFGADSFLPSKYKTSTRDSDSDKDRKKKARKERYEDDLAYGNTSNLVGGKYPSDDTMPTAYNYAKPPQYEYAKVDNTYGHSRPEPQYGARLGSGSEPRRGRSPSPGPGKLQHRDSYNSGQNVVTVEPGSSRRGRSPQPPVQRMSSLSVSTPHHSANLTLANAPGSPLLESYHGTYQSMSPMPSPLLMPSHGGADIIEPLSPGVSDDERGERKRRRARFHDPVDDAARLAKALKGERRAPDTEPLIEILPGLTHEQIMELRTEYKRLVKTGSEKKGVNVAKHIRARLKDEDSNLMKACYSVALGQWESEAYWANFWYQGDKTRRELLIESLMGRTNHEIRLIKDGFSDKKYSNSLTKCMKTELKEDKFKKAVLLILEERRMEEYDEYGRLIPPNWAEIEDDARDLYKAVRSEKGGESAMINIVVMRSDSHLREVLKLYERSYRSNFAKDALKKSGNLVGEVLAHILNGVINKPVRDAMLIHHALSASKKDGLRRELLISRLVRYHWDQQHMAAIKRAYRERYKGDLQEAVKEGTNGEWGQFCRELVVTRTAGDVRRFEKVEIINR